ncbi:MAG TPA: hypothetical protein PK542_11580, partial [Treponemataceae bacterium]|nr:hypothetical protein [Treponemataceae bacterium]
MERHSLPRARALSILLAVACILAFGPLPVRASVKVRLTMTASADGLLSPAIDTVNSQFVGLLLAAAGDYVTRMTQL